MRLTVKILPCAAQLVWRVQISLTLHQSWRSSALRAFTWCAPPAGWCRAVVCTVCCSRSGRCVPCACCQCVRSVLTFAQCRLHLSLAVVQCVLDSSPELIEVLESKLPAALAKQPEGSLSLVVIDSVGAFYPMDRACTVLPPSPILPSPPLNGPAEAHMPCTTFVTTAPVATPTLQRVHTSLVQALRGILRSSTVAFVTLKTSVQPDTHGLLQHRPYLPDVWKVRCSASRITS